MADALPFPLPIPAGSVPAPAARPTWRAHDLLVLAARPGLARLLSAVAPVPAWAADQAVRGDEPVVVRRAVPRGPGWLPVGLRGATRGERRAAHAYADDVVRAVTPEDLARGRPWRLRQQPEPSAALRLLDRVAPLLDASALAWGVTGAAGHTLAGGSDVLRPQRDPDLLLRAPSPDDAPALRAVAAALAALRAPEARIDVLVETPLGAFALAEWARDGGPALLLRTCAGPRLVADPWRAGTDDGAAPADAAADAATLVPRHPAALDADAKAAARIGSAAPRCLDADAAPDGVAAAPGVGTAPGPASTEAGARSDAASVAGEAGLAVPRRPAPASARRERPLHLPRPGRAAPRLPARAARRPARRRTLDEAGGVLGVDARTLDGAAALASTVAAQLALLVAGVAAARLFEREAGPPDAVAGLSVGAYPAAVTAGVLGFADALALVRRRGELMQAAYPDGRHGMLAILGLDEAALAPLVAQVHRADAPVHLANLNAPTQLVLAASAARWRASPSWRWPAAPPTRSRSTSPCRRTARCSTRPPTRWSAPSPR